MSLPLLIIRLAREHASGASRVPRERAHCEVARNPHAKRAARSVRAGKWRGKGGRLIFAKRK